MSNETKRLCSLAIVCPKSAFQSDTLNPGTNRKTGNISQHWSFNFEINVFCEFK